MFMYKERIKGRSKEVTGSRVKEKMNKCFLRPVFFQMKRTVIIHQSEGVV